MNIFFSLNFIDQKISWAIVNLRSDFWDHFFYFITIFGTWYMITLLFVLSAYLLWLNKRKELIFPFFVTVLGSGITNLIIKYLIDRPRPSAGIALYTETGYSFPSAHAALIIALFGFFIYIFWRSDFISVVGKNLIIKTISTILFAIIIILIGFSRLYLGVHYLSDILSGYLVGLVWVVIGIYIYRKSFTSK